MPAVLTRLEGVVLASARVNVRDGEPNTAAPILRRLEQGAEFKIIGLTKGEAIAGQDDWYVGEAGGYVWSPAMRLADASNSAGFISGNGLRREDGTLKALPRDRVRALFGDFAYEEGQGGRIRPDPAWGQANLRKIVIPGVIDADGQEMWVHVKAAPYFEKAFADVVAAGLANRILTFDGTYVPRHMGWDPNRALSSHSWGIAIDLNTAWNAYGKDPAPLGATGSLREVVPYFEAAGFAWGGRFQPQSLCDGMHFELALTDLGAPAIMAAGPAPSAPSVATAAGSAYVFSLSQETTGERTDWTFNDPVTGVRRQAGRVTRYQMADPKAPKTSLPTRGLSRYGGFSGEKSPLYDAAEWRPAFGYWADFVQPTAQGESYRNFTCVNSYDRAAFTFGCFQFAAHTVDRNLIRLFRALLQLPEAGLYFPDLKLVDGKVSVLRNGGYASLEGAAQRADGLNRPGEQGAFMDYLNRAYPSADADEALAAARLISWACNSPDHRQAQVREGIWIAQTLLKETHTALSALGSSLDGVGMPVCAMIFDIRHQGRTHAGFPKLYPAIKAALAAPNPMAMLMEFGVPPHGDRVNAVHDMIHEKIAATSLGALKYSAADAAFV